MRCRPTDGVYALLISNDFRDHNIQQGDLSLQTPTNRRDKGLPTGPMPIPDGALEAALHPNPLRRPVS